MNDIIAQFAEIIQDFSTSKEGVIGEKEIERSIIIFTNNTRLVVYEATTGTKFKYSYQWMNNQNQTIFRWDNTPHFPNFSSFPFHRHVGQNEIAEPFPKVSLEDVLHFIENLLS
jgi:hypothetical protein